MGGKYANSIVGHFNISMHKRIRQAGSRIADHATIDDGKSGENNTARKMFVAVVIMRIEPVRISKIFADEIDIGVIGCIERMKELLEAKYIRILLFDQLHHFYPGLAAWDWDFLSC